MLARLFDEFCRVRGGSLAEPFMLALSWYQKCNTHSAGMEGSLILGLTALELLSAMVVVDHRQSMLPKMHDSLSAARKLDGLLNAMGVSSAIPSRHAELTTFAKRQSWADACKTLTEFRHGYVHPTKERRRVVLEADTRVVFQAWQLSLWYQELALLYLLQHRGNYRDRVTPKRVGQVTPVPWSSTADQSGSCGG